ncbi:RXT2 [Candida margitis]|uniref:RXT2 n=1 Tax=Candida margitis TaxID=1775924 RepID=UPI0022270565|nr:RXT2 [Candida margitis]KAI5970072.1 RXT2 [Candida margitis]
MDSKSLEIIAQFKDALITRNKLGPDGVSTNSSTKTATTFEANDTLPIYNRGLKLLFQHPSLDSLNSKAVEYNGDKYTVLTNHSIERGNMRNKRKWSEFYNDSNDNNNGVDGDDAEWSDDDEYGDEDRIHPLKQSRIIELLSPINHPSELVTHPAISKTYQSKTLNKLAMELIELIEFEQNNLNWLNKLLQVLNGEDWFYLLEENIGLKDYDHGLDEDKKKSIAKKREKAKSIISQDPNTSNDYKSEEEEQADPFFALPTAVKRFETFQDQLDAKDETGVKEELINYLQVSIQRQHEYIENLTQLRNGMVRADRLKNDLYKWGQEMHDKKSS